MAKVLLKKQELIDKLQTRKAVAQIPGWCDWTAEQASAYIEKNVTDLASAKTVMKKMAEMIILLRNGVI